MGFLDKIKNTFSSGKLKKEQIEKLRESIWAAVADGEITDQEFEYINSFYTDSELSPENFQKLRSEIFVQVVQQAIADKRVGEEELQVLNHLIKRLEISPEVEAWAQEHVQYYSLFAQIESGQPLQEIQPVGLILQKNEIGYLCLPADWLEERVISRNYVGGNRGVNVRIMKGISYRVGQQRGQIQSQMGMVVVSEGYFIITNKRLVFSGNRKSVSTTFEKLLDLQVFSDALNFSTSTRQKPVIIKLSKSEEAELCGVLISRLINE